MLAPVVHPADPSTPGRAVPAVPSAPSAPSAHSALLQHCAATVVEVQARYAQASISLAEAALAGAHQFVEWAHHPRQDWVDARHGTRFFYHAHAAEERMAGEHGHFHLFVPARMPGGPGFSHLAGLSLDARGLPLRWFTTNRWVTGEQWADADTLVAALPRLQWQARGRLGPVGRWLGAMVQLHADELTRLLHARDARLQALAAAQQRSPEALWDDRSLHILTQCPIDLLARLAAVDADA